MKKNIYKNMYETANDLYLKTNPRIKIMSEILNKTDLKNKKVLDIGCYDGTLLSSIKENSAKLFGIEASDYGIAKSKNKNINVTQFFFDDKDKIPFENNFFDIVIAGEIIEHIYDTDFFLKEVHRILKPKGKFLASTPNIASLGRRFFLFFGKNPIIEISPNEPDSSGHIRYFTFENFEKLLKKNNFKITYSQSDVINFSASGKIKSKLLAKIWKELGQSIICLSEK